LVIDPSLVHRVFYPQVPLVLSAGHRGRISAMPVVSYLSISTVPPLVGAACNPEGFTCKLAQRSGAFSLCVLDRDHSDAVSFLATTSGALTKDKLAAAGLPHGKGRKLNVPVIHGAEATLECSLKKKESIGDHVLLVGGVEVAYASGKFTDSWDFRRYRPLLYTGWRDRLTTYPED
jgi:flavin reductase (DIM6/NTAB) family NADH-FMN oxidoreductase RutF